MSEEPSAAQFPGSEAPKPSSASELQLYTGTCSVHAAKSATPTPLPADALEYFSETAAKMGGSAASGMMIQCPDGRPAGIFFQPMSSSSISSTSSSSASTPGVGRYGISSPLARDMGASGCVQEASDKELGPSRRSSSSTASVDQPKFLNQINPGASASRPREASNRSLRSHEPTQVGPPTRYPSGSIFAPQVGIQSVLSGDRPPVATPLGSKKSPIPPQAVLEDVSREGAADKGNGSEQSEKGAPTSGAASPTIQPAKDAATTPSEDAAASSSRTPPRKKTTATVISPAIHVAEATPPKIKTKVPGDTLAPSSPVVVGSAGTSQNPSNKLMARQSFAIAPSPSDTRRPSAQPQSGFMIGMGFAPTARRGTGPKKAPVREAVLPPIKVLIVEDNPINQRILSMFMSRKKIKFDVATNGKEAVDKWQTGGFHLILMDIQLPVMDGIEATKEIRKLERSANIGILPSTPPATSTHSSASKKELDWKPSPFRAQVIIVALTASVLSSDRVEALAAGCNDFLNKPVSLPWLNQKILEWGSMMYLIYAGLGQEDVVSKAQVHLGFGYGPAEKAKALASNLHMGTAALGKQKKADAAATAAATSQ